MWTNYFVTSFVKYYKKNNALLVVDDAHGIGVLGKEGRGICEHFNISSRNIDLLITPFGKAFAGLGAMVSESKQ